MVLTGCSPRLIVNNSLSGLCAIVDEQVGHEAMVEHMINKLKLVANIYKTLLENVEQAQKKQWKIYVASKGLQLLKGLRKGIPKLKPSKKRNLMGSWEGPYHFVNNMDGKGCQQHDEGSRTCIIKDLGGKCWEKQEEIFRFTTH
jgi:hypothetical protein